MGSDDHSGTRTNFCKDGSVNMSIIDEGAQDKLLKRINGIVTYIDPLKQLCDSFQEKKTHLTQLSCSIELADKLIADLTIPSEFSKYTNSFYMCSFIENNQFNVEYQDKLIELDERMERSQGWKSKGFDSALETHSHLQRLSKTACKKVLDYFIANITIFTRQPAGRRLSLLSASFNNFQQNVLRSYTSSMSFVLKYGDARRTISFMDSYSDVTKQHLMHISNQIVRSFPVPTKTKGYFFAVEDRETKRSSLVKKLKRNLSLSRRVNGVEVDLPGLLEGSYTLLLQTLHSEIIFEDSFFAGLGTKPYQSISQPVLVSYEVNWNFIFLSRNW